MTRRARTARSTALAAVVCAGLAASLAGCGSEDPDKGTNGIGRKSPAKIETQARSAAERASSVKLSGSVVSQGRTYKLDMRLKQDAGSGEVSTAGGDTIELLRSGQDLYLKADTGFWAKQEKHGKHPTQGDTAAAGKLKGKYVKVPHSDPAYQQLSGFTDMKVMLSSLLVLDGKRETGDRRETGGVRTIQVRAGQGSGGIMDVSLKGTPYPLRMQRGGGAGTLQLSDWNKQFTIQTPLKNEVVDYGKRISASGD
ncbi:hypothetical protein [Streptomyces sp. ODS28]|uniref:hypothetical protein n=1 Tax=Streptomyces sp. ODS28 TaxID=3136688 RepID=UPI0031E84515